MLGQRLGGLDSLISCFLEVIELVVLSNVGQVGDLLVLLHSRNFLRLQVHGLEFQF